MRRSRPRSWIRFVGSGLAAWLCLSCTCARDDATTPPAPPTPPASQAKPVSTPSPAEFVGRAACASCHDKEHTAWRGSHHDLAMQEPTPETVLGNFHGARAAHSGESFEFLIEQGRYVVRVSRKGERPRTLPVRYTFGFTPLQQYLVDVGNGRLQALGVAWDSRAKAEGGQRWFHLREGEHVPPGDALHWEGPQYNWNAMCADCHSTGVKRGYDAQQGTFATTFEEIDVSCETCHGAGSLHVAWARSASRDAALPGRGLSVDLTPPADRRWVRDAGARIAHMEGGSGQAQLEACAPCHSRRAELGPGHGATFHDRYRLSLLTAPLYYSDGQQREEVFVYGSFLQSKMYARGVVCSDCHEPHSGTLRKPGNDLCTTCHDPGAYDQTSHHFHDPGTRGAMCTSCHMPETTYMGVDARADHAFQIPSPALAEKVGSPDVCTGCHEGRTAAWAEAAIRQHYPAGRRNPAVALAFSRAERRERGAADGLLSVASNPQLPAITRATALEALADFPSPALLELTRGLRSSPDPVLRRAVIAASVAFPAPDRSKLLAPLLADPTRSVRTEAAQNLLDAPAVQFDAATQQRLDQAMAEYLATQDWSLDRAESLVNLADMHRRTGDLARAEELLTQALARDPAFSPGYLNLADLHRQRGKDELAVVVLESGLERAADPAVLQHALGLTLVRLGKQEQALTALGAAHAASPERTQFGYVYAVALFDLNRREKAIDVLANLAERAPADAQILQTLISYLAKDGQTGRAQEYAARLAELDQPRR